MADNMIQHVVIAGAGLMGASIAQIFPMHGYTTTLYSCYVEDFQRASEIIDRCQRTLVENGVLTEAASEEIKRKLIYTTDITCFERADLVIEAIPEVMDIKASFYKGISDYLKDDCIVASNTSALSINELGKHLSHPERFCGTHWLNPPHIIPLVEVVPSDKTEEWIVDTLVRLFKDLDKEPVVLKKDIKGFLSNRLQFALLREAAYLVEEGVATPEDIDRTLRYGNGIRYACSGPFKIVDLGGAQVFNNVAKYLFPVLGDEKDSCKLLETMVANGHLGTSSGKGFYGYNGDDAAMEESARDRMMLDILRSAEALSKN